MLERGGERDVPRLAALESVALSYEPFDPLQQLPVVPDAPEALGPAGPLFALERGLGSPLTQDVVSRDGIRARIRWTP